MGPGRNALRATRCHRSGSHGDAAALGHAPAVGMGETFHSLLRLDWSFQDRGRDARQSTVSVQPVLTDESNAPAGPDDPVQPACADRLYGLESTDLESEINERSDNAGGSTGDGG